MRQHGITAKIAVVLAVGLLNVVASGAAAGGETPERPPNFIMILADDLGYGDLGCYGSTTIRTPRLDRMAAEGTRFTDFYSASPLCSPSRVALLTGCYPTRLGLGAGVLRPDSKAGIPLAQRTLAELLKSQGYATACVGKWHVGFRPPFRPRARGFDEYFGLFHNLDDWEMKYFGTLGVPLLRGDEIVKRPVPPAEVTELYTAEALRIIRQNRQRPFFLYLAHTMPHEPFGVSPRFAGKSAGGVYGDVVECLDWSTGQILDELDRLGLRRETIVVFTSDNGPATHFGGSAGPLRGAKNTTYEGGLREPCLVWGPGRVAAGRVCHAAAAMFDFYPTLARLAGAKLPSEGRIDGCDIGPLLFGAPDAPSPHEAFFYHSGQGELAAVRSGRWKLHLGGKPALYDLEQDVGEQHDLLASRPQVVARLRELAAQFRADIQQHSLPAGNAEGPVPGLPQASAAPP